VRRDAVGLFKSILPEVHTKVPRSTGGSMPLHYDDIEQLVLILSKNALNAEDQRDYFAARLRAANFSQAFLFEATQSGPLASIVVALGRSSESATATSFTLFEDSGLAFGTFLETLTIANTTQPLPSTGMVVTLDSILQPTLNAGQSYWLAFGDAGPIGSLWFFNDQGFVGPRTGGVSDIAALPAFRVEVVPEPATGVLLLAGLLLLDVGRRSRSSIRA